MNDDSKHLDATKPGNIPVSHTSKPALVGHQALPHDPMMRGPEKPDATFTVKDHKEVSLQPTMPKADLEAQQPTAASKNADTELPKGVIENKKPIVDQQAVQVQDLVDKKTYNLPIQSTPTKTLLKVVIIILVIIGIATGAFVVFAMNR